MHEKALPPVSDSHVAGAFQVIGRSSTCFASQSLRQGILSGRHRGDAGIAAMHVVEECPAAPLSEAEGSERQIDQNL